MNLKTRFGNLKYNHFKVEFKGLIFEVKLIDDCALFPNSDDKTTHEEFKVIITNVNTNITYKFYNSQMEREISEKLKEVKHVPYTFYQVKTILKNGVLKMWGGYDDVKSFKDLENARIENLFYGIINSLANDLNFYPDFFDFCDSYGYDRDSRRAEKIYNSCIELKEKVDSLRLTQKQKDYLNNIAACEEKGFKEDIHEAIQKAQEKT